MLTHTGNNNIFLPQSQVVHAIIKRILSDTNNNFNPDEVTEILKKTVKIIRSIKKKLQKEEEIYRTLMQDFGDNIRKTGNPYNYKSPIKPEEKNKDKIHLTLAKNAELLINFLYKKRGHSFFIIDSFRNPYEALYFKEKFNNFYLLSVYASVKERRERFDKFDEEGEKRDQGKYIKKIDDNFYMQNVPKTVRFSDIAINNDDNFPRKNGKLNKDKLIEKTIRYIALIFDTGCTKPNNDEVMMNLAYTMAMKSNCISRQVGAVIEGKNGYVVGAGWNDVGEGKISCGLREIKDLNREKYKAYINELKDKADNPSEDIVINRLIQKYKYTNRNPVLKDDELERFCFCFKDAYSKKKLNEKIQNLNFSNNHRFSYR